MRTTMKLFLLLLILCGTGCSVSEVVRLGDRRTMPVGAMVDEVRDSRVIFVGESHDVAAHHKLQLEVIKRLHEQGKPVAIGLEMFEASTQGALEQWVAGKVPASAFKKIYQWNWRNMPWGLYEDIFLYARDQHIPMVGLNAPRNIVQQVSQLGFDSLSAEQLKELPPGVTGQVSDEYLRLIGAQYSMHGRQGDSFRHICEAQMLRNRFMAHTIGSYLAKHPERTVVVLAGGGHVRQKGGIPAELAAIPYRIVIPAIPGQEKYITVDDADYLMVEPFSFLDWLL